MTIKRDYLLRQADAALDYAAGSRSVAADAMLILTQAHITVIEDAYGSLSEWLSRCPVEMQPWMPFAETDDCPMLAFIDDSASGRLHPSVVDRTSRYITMWCDTHGASIHYGDDEGADRAGGEMLRHVLANPDCSGKLDLLSGVRSTREEDEEAFWGKQ